MKNGIFLLLFKLKLHFCKQIAKNIRKRITAEKKKCRKKKRKYPIHEYIRIDDIPFKKKKTKKPKNISKRNTIVVPFGFP